MEFEYDPLKSESNKIKHGIDFEEAQRIWDDENAIQIETFTAPDEIRFLVIGRINAVHWTAVITIRSRNIRIISVRRSRNNEIEIYDQSK